MWLFVIGENNNHSQILKYMFEETHFKLYTYTSVSLFEQK